MPEQLNRQHVGISTTVPVEVLLAAGVTPVDLNNLFINDRNPERLITKAEQSGLPRTVCAWIKGVAGTAEENSIEKVIVVTEGDCSEAHALAQLFSHDGFEVIPFAFPQSRDPDKLRAEIEKLASAFGTTIGAAEQKRKQLLPLREKLHEIDQNTYTSCRVTGAENFNWLVSASDFNRDVKKFSLHVDEFLREAETRDPRKPEIRLGLLGVPPIMSDLFKVLSEAGAEVVFNEYPREYAMIRPAGNLVEQYLDYTYPYDNDHRMKNVLAEIEKRNINGIISYTQTFCHRAILDKLVKQQCPVPVLTLEGDRPGPCDGRTRTRLEGFIEMLEG